MTTENEGLKFRRIPDTNAFAVFSTCDIRLGEIRWREQVGDYVCFVINCGHPFDVEELEQICSEMARLYVERYVELPNRISTSSSTPSSSSS